LAMAYPENNSQNDAALAIKLRDTGDASAFEALYKRHSALLSSFLFRLAGDRTPALLPKMIERLRDRSYAIRDVENFHLWALGVVASFWREETKHNDLPKESDPAAFKVIHRMAYYLRPVFILVHYFQMPIDDVAAALRIPRGTATSRLQDAFASLVAQVAPAEPPPLPEIEEPSVVIVDIQSEAIVASSQDEKAAASAEASPSSEAPKATEEKPVVIVAATEPVKEKATVKLPAIEENPAPMPVLAALEKASEAPKLPPTTPVPASQVPPLPLASPPPIPSGPPPLPPLFTSPLSPPQSSASGSALAALIPKLSFPSTEPPKEPEKS
jgi:DNA-directed RNA polymerase specialized sigma24 family protein